MRKLFLFAGLALLLALQTGQTESYVYSVTSSGAPARWNLTGTSTPSIRNGRLVYNLNPAGSADVPFAQVETAIANSFKVWEDIPTCSIAFTRGENRSETGASNDGIFQLYWREDATLDDGLDITGALGVARLVMIAGGSRDGEVLDASLVFNGKEYQWATDGSANRADIAEVATHEIGHVLGISHSPMAGATMFPRTGLGSLRNRTLSTDDIIAASATYPAGDFTTANGTLRGTVRDNSGGALFGANVVVVDGNGNVAATVFTQRDGSYRLPGLAPGTYTALVEPVEPSGSFFFSSSDLSPFYTSINTDFLTSADVNVTLRAGGETVQDFAVTRGTPAYNLQLAYDAPRGSFINQGLFASAGQSLTIGVAGNNLPNTGTPLSVSGPGITLTRTQFATLSNGFRGIVADITIAANAAPGARNLIVTGNGQRAVLIGGLEILAGTAPAIATVSAANFRTNLASESIVAAFGNNLATGRATATTAPLPTTLGGTTVTLRDSVGNQRNAPLFFVSPTQINYQIAPGLQIGPVSVTITNGSGQTVSGNFQLEAVAPGLFSAAGNGQGAAAALALRIKANGAQSFEPVARLDTSTNKFVTVPLDLSIAGDQVFLVLFGTGIRFRSSLAGVTVNVGGTNQLVTFAQAQGTQVGLDQINVRLDSALRGRGEIDVFTTVDGRASNTVKVNIK